MNSILETLGASAQDIGTSRVSSAPAPPTTYGVKLAIFFNASLGVVVHCSYMYFHITF